jgi:hypothetical protein
VALDALLTDLIKIHKILVGAAAQAELKRPGTVDVGLKVRPLLKGHGFSKERIEEVLWYLDHNHLGLAMCRGKVGDDQNNEDPYMQWWEIKPRSGPPPRAALAKMVGRTGKNGRYTPRRRSGSATATITSATLPDQPTEGKPATTGRSGARVRDRTAAAPTHATTAISNGAADASLEDLIAMRDQLAAEKSRLRAQLAEQVRREQDEVDRLRAALGEG